MPRAETQSIERFFQLSLLGLVTSGYLAVVGSGYLDAPTIALTTAGLFARALWICGILRFTISERATTIITIAYSAFFLLDYVALSHEFLACTVHLLFFLAVMKILTARNSRDYLYTAVIAFLELLAAAILSINFNFFLFLALYLIFAIATLASAEIHRAMRRKDVATARTGPRRFGPRLAVLAMLVTIGILVLTGGLFFILPRTAEAAFARFGPHRGFLPGFATQVTLGEIGEIKTSSRPVMHISIYQRVGGLKWRGGALTEFDGKRWTTNPTRQPLRMDVQDGHIVLAQSDRYPFGRRISYHVDLEPLQNPELYFSGTPEFLDLRSRVLYRSYADVYTLGKPLTEGFRYDASSLLEDPPERTTPLTPAPVLSLAERSHNLQLPRLDPRIGELARTVTAGAPGDLERARAIERHLRTAYSYTLELPSRETADPLAYFLFNRRKGHCEYFASAMAVMLRSVGVPARLATGFQSGIYNDVTDLWLIRAGDAHSWVEAWIPGHGWTTFDPTPPDTQRTFALFTRLQLYLDATETFWRDWVVTYDIARQGTLAYRMEQNARRMGIRWFDAALAVKSAWSTYVIGGGRRFGWPLVWIAAGAFLAWVLGRPLLRLLRMRQRVQRIRRGEASVADATLLYQRMLEILGKHGYHKPPWFTPVEFAASLPGGPLAVAVTEFTTTYNALRFGGYVETASQLSMLLDRMESE